MKSLLVLLVVVFVMGVAGVWFWQEGRWLLPDRHNPWTPLRLAEPPGWLTRLKLRRLAEDPAECRAVLAQAGWQTSPVPDRQQAEGCGWRDAVRIERMQLRVGQPFTLTCPAAVSLALWERHTLQPAAQALLGTEVVALDHFGSYACRNLYGRETGARSRHATAQAFDVAGFVLGDGRRIRVARDWSGDGDAARFLRQVHEGACDSFDVVLGPEYNAAHADHLHLDLGGGRVCR